MKRTSTVIYSSLMKIQVNHFIHSYMPLLSCCCCCVVSLDKPGVNRRPRNSDLDNHKGGGAKRDPMAARPMLPIPRTGSQSGPDRHRANHPGLSAPLSTSLPPPLPTRRRCVWIVSSYPQKCHSSRL